MNKIQVQDLQNKITIYSDLHESYCLQCGRAISSGYTCSGYHVFFDIETKQIHPIHVNAGKINGQNFDDHEKEVQSETYFKPEKKRGKQKTSKGKIK